MVNNGLMEKKKMDAMNHFVIVDHFLFHNLDFLQKFFFIHQISFHIFKLMS